MSNNLPSFQISARSHPSAGSKVIQEVFDFTAAVSIIGDFLLEMMDGHIDNIQSVKIDNSQNPDQFILLVLGVGTVGDTIVVPPNTQGVYPITAPIGKLNYVASSFGGVKVPVNFYNIELPYYQASSVGQVSGIITGADNNFSGVCNGADAIVIPANANRKRVIIQNAAANNTSLWVRSGAAATEDNNSQEVQPGQEYDTGQGPISTAAIHVIGANGVTYYANEIV